MVAAAVALVACLPEGAPPWQVDHPIAAAIRVDIAKRGPYGPTSPRPDRVIAAAMPDMDLLIHPRDMPGHSAASLNAYAAALGCTGLGLGHATGLTLDGIAGITNIWRADSPAQLAQAFALAPHSITTDDPVAALTLRAARATSNA